MCRRVLRKTSPPGVRMQYQKIAPGLLLALHDFDHAKNSADQRSVLARHARLLGLPTIAPILAPPRPDLVSPPMASRASAHQPAATSCRGLRPLPYREVSPQDSDEEASARQSEHREGPHRLRAPRCD